MRVAGGAEEVTTGVGVKAVHGVAGAGRQIGAIQMLNGGNVIQQRSSGVMTAVIPTGVGFAPVAHQAELAGIFRISGVAVGWVAFTGVVIARVAQAQRMANLMGERLAAVVFGRRVFHVGLVDVVPGLAAQILTLPNGVRQEGIGLSAVIIVAGAILAVVAEGDVGF